MENKLNRKELKAAFKSGLIDEEKYKDELFRIESSNATGKKKERKIPKCVRSDEFPKLIKAIPSKDKISKIAFLLAYGGGMRVSEVIRCSPEHFRPGSIFIPESKYGVERVVPIPKGWKDWMLKEIPIKLTIRSLERRFVKYRKLANLPEHYTFHSLRHGFATRLLEAGTPINQVQILLGHSNTATTSVYVKANPIDAIKSYEELF